MRYPMHHDITKMKKILKALYRAVHFFCRVLWRKDYDGRCSVGETLYCSGVVYDLWMDRLGKR